MVMVIYHLDQFWPQAKHLRHLVLGRWQSQGWTVSRPWSSDPNAVLDTLTPVQGRTGEPEHDERPPGSLLRLVSSIWSCSLHSIVNFDRSGWDDRSFDVYVVYLTHGLSGGKGYQIGGKESYPPTEVSGTRQAGPTLIVSPIQFFSHTTENVRQLAERARAVRALLLCCGHPFMSPQQTRDMQLWMNGQVPSLLPPSLLVRGNDRRT